MSAGHYLIEKWESNCGLNLVYNGVRFGYERHMARDLHRELSEQIAEWDAENAKNRAAAPRKSGGAEGGAV